MHEVVMGRVQARLSFAILRVTLLCVRGSRTKWRSLRIVDGASLLLLSLDKLFCVCFVLSVFLFMFLFG